MRYSPSVGTFYPEFLIYPKLPNDLLTVPEEDAVKAQNAIQGSTITYKDGRLIITPPTTNPA